MNRVPRCDAEIMLMDDRWGAFTDRCEGDEGHDGDHFHVMGATMPLGRLVWPNESHAHSWRTEGDGIYEAFYSRCEDCGAIQ